MENTEIRTCDNCGYNTVCTDCKAGQPLCRYYISKNFRMKALWDHNDVDLHDRLMYEQHHNRTKAHLWILLDIVIALTIISISLYHAGLFSASVRWFNATVRPILPMIIAILQKISLLISGFAILGILLHKTTWAVKTLHRGK